MKSMDSKLDPGLQTRPRTCSWDEKTWLDENWCFHERKGILHFYPSHKKSKFSLSKKVVLFSFSLFYFICYFTREDLNYFYSIKKKKEEEGKKKRINPNAKSEKRQKSDSAYWLVSAGSLNHRKRRALGDEIEFGRLLNLEELGVYMGSFFCEEEQGIW